MLRGRPGSGKTTALWRAIEARSGENVLYVTWSARLQRSAEERLAAFAPSTSRVRATDFRDADGEVTGADVRRIPPAESRRKLGVAIEQAVGHERHPWKGHEAAVYAEVRGRLLGRGVDGEADSDDGAKLAALRPDAYRRQRGNEQGIGAATAKTLLRFWEKVPESARVEIFPELAAAAAAARLLSSKGLPEGMEFDRLVVDEAQDLTLTEFWMLPVERPWLEPSTRPGYTVSPGCVPRPSLSEDVLDVVRGIAGGVAGVRAPAFVERAGLRRLRRPDRECRRGACPGLR